jgi:hypothetical protein
MIWNWYLLKQLVRFGVFYKRDALHLDGLRRSLSLGRLEFGDIFLGLLRLRSLLDNGLLFLLVACKVLTELLDLVDELVGTSLDRHTSAVETHREESSLALHAGNAGSELDLTDGERVASVQSSVHVGVGHASKELGLLLTELGGGHGMEGHLADAGRVGFEDMLLLPDLLVLLLNGDEGVSLLSLDTVRGMDISCKLPEVPLTPLSSLVLEIWRDSMALGTASVEAMVANGQDL